MTKKPFRVLSWGCGAPSTSLGVMSAFGHLPRLDAIITSDTGWERKATYEARDFYAEWFRDRGIRVEILGGRDIRVEGATEHIHIPFWTSDGGPLQRQCTRDFKIRPVRRRVRELIGLHASLPPNPPKGAVEQWLGYSWEEVGRQKESDVEFIVNKCPLIDKRWTRGHCEAYLERLGLPVPVKSACVGCPYRTSAEWLELKNWSRDEFADAVEFDEENRHNPLAERTGSLADQLYIYKDPRTEEPVALAEADLDGAAEWQRKRGQQGMLNFCEGPCGT